MKSNSAAEDSKLTTIQVNMCGEIAERSNNNYGCPFCSYGSDKSANLLRHVRSMHETVKESLVCCGQQFNSKSEFRDHNKTSHREGHQCPVCEKSFSRRALLKRHQSVHTGIKDFKCDLCNYSSSHKSNVVRHLKIHRNLAYVAAIEQKCPHPEPDSTTPVTTTKSSCGNNSKECLKNNGILRSMLNCEKGTQKSSPLGDEKKKLKHSIESILQGSRTEMNVRSEAVNERRTRSPSYDSDDPVGQPETRSKGREYLQQEGQDDGRDTKIDTVGTNCGFNKETDWRPTVFLQNGIIANSTMTNGRSTYSIASTFPTYLAPIDGNGFPATNWTRDNSSSLSFPTISATPSTASTLLPSPHASLYGLVPGFGSIFGPEESRYLSPPHLQSPSGLHLAPASAFQHHNRSVQLEQESMGLPRAACFPPLLASPHMFALSSPSSAVEFTAGPSRKSKKRSGTATPSGPAAGGNFSDLAGACLTFSQVSNSKLTHFVSY